jgi:hypothetical protein
MYCKAMIFLTEMKKIKYTQLVSTLLLVGLFTVVFSFVPKNVNAQNTSVPAATTSSSTAVTAAQSEAVKDSKVRNEKPELQENPIIIPVNETSQEILSVRSLEEITFFNFFAYIIHEAVTRGVPAETVSLTLLLPVLATVVAFSKNIVGLRSFSMIVVITTSIAFLASNLLIGNILFGVILLASVIARSLFKRLKIMQIPKISLSIFFVSLFVLMSFVLMSTIEFFNIKSISIVPILLFIILSEKIVRLQFDKSFNESLGVILNSLFLGIFGYYIFSIKEVRETILIYPEIILLLVPINIAIGRYFGLRLTERLRFDLLKK